MWGFFLLKLFIYMFKYISEILKSFTPAQRITALLILVLSIIILTLGSDVIKNGSCDELTLRVKNQEEQIVELNKRITDLNNELLSGQKECTDNLIAKQKQIMEIVNGMIADAELSNKKPKVVMMRKTTEPSFSETNENGSEEMKVQPSPSLTYIKNTDNSEMVNKLKQLKNKIQKSISY